MLHTSFECYCNRSFTVCC